MFKFCPNCGNQLSGDPSFCGNCGADLRKFSGEELKVCEKGKSASSADVSIDDSLSAITDLAKQAVADKRNEEKRKRAEEALKAEKQRREEEALRVEAEQKRLEIERKIAEENRRAEEVRLATQAEAARKAEAERKAAEENRKAEEARMAAEKAAAQRAEEARRSAEAEAARKAEAERKAAEENRRAEEARIAAEKAAARKAEEARRIAEAEAAHKAEIERKAAEERKRKEEAEKAEAQKKVAEAIRSDSNILDKYFKYTIDIYSHIVAITGLVDKTVKSVVIPSVVTDIKKEAFANSAIEELILPDGVKRIEERAFCDCLSLRQVTIPATTWFLDKSAFCGCKNLKTLKITIGGELAKIGLHEKSDKFSGSYKEILQNEYGRKFVSLFDGLKSNNIELKISFANDVHIICERFFEDCVCLREIKINGLIREIKDHAFYRCKNLASVDLASIDLPATGKNIFGNCKSLKKIIIHSSGIAKAFTKVCFYRSFAANFKNNIPRGCQVYYNDKKVDIERKTTRDSSNLFN